MRRPHAGRPHFAGPSRIEKGEGSEEPSPYLLTPQQLRSTRLRRYGVAPACEPTVTAPMAVTAAMPAFRR
jgi:hypothetical protein